MYLQIYAFVIKCFLSILLSVSRKVTVTAFHDALTERMLMGKVGIPILLHDQMSQFRCFAIPVT